MVLMYIVIGLLAVIVGAEIVRSEQQETRIRALERQMIERKPQTPAHRRSANPLLDRQRERIMARMESEHFADVGKMVGSEVKANGLEK